jgi:uncharacterized membrane protein
LVFQTFYYIKDQKGIIYIIKVPFGLFKKIISIIIIMLNIQSIYFSKHKYTIDESINYLKKNKLDHYKRINEDKYYYRFTFQSRIKLQNNNYYKQIEYLDDSNIKIDHYTKPEITYNLTIEFD